ncbi:MAG TPA: hypothetical protein VFW84_16885 [Aquabacterium sp.]|nr:hypothetical protein [Aquabacterium sp.]
MKLKVPAREEEALSVSARLVSLALKVNAVDPAVFMKLNDDVMPSFGSRSIKVKVRPDTLAEARDAA